MAPHHELEVGGLRIAYERAGSGPPLVFLHGAVGDGQATWHPQLDALSAAYTVVAWDAPGCGRSSDPPESFALSDYADCLAALVRGLRLVRPVVVGLSFGGGLALELYRRHPLIPRALVLVSAYAGWAGSLPAAEVRERLRQAIDLAELPPERFMDAVAPSLFSPAASGDVVDRFVASASQFHPTGLRAMTRAFANADLRDVLPAVRVPTLLVYGNRDVRAPIEVALQLHLGIAGSRLVVLPGLGHMNNLEAPDRFTGELRSFERSLEAPLH